MDTYIQYIVTLWQPLTGTLDADKNIICTQLGTDVRQRFLAENEM